MTAKYSEHLSYLWPDRYQTDNESYYLLAFLVRHETAQQALCYFGFIRASIPFSYIVQGTYFTISSNLYQRCNGDRSYAADGGKLHVTDNRSKRKVTLRSGQSEEQ